GLEDQTKLVLGCHGRPDDSTARPAFHVEADWGEGCGGPRQSRDLRLSTRCGGEVHCGGFQESERSGALGLVGICGWVMQSIDLIRGNLMTSRDRVLARVEEMREHCIVFPTSRGGCHTLWVLGHLAYIEALIVHGF